MTTEPKPDQKKINSEEFDKFGYLKIDNTGDTKLIIENPVISTKNDITQEPNDLQSQKKENVINQPIQTSPLTLPLSLPLIQRPIKITNSKQHKSLYEYKSPQLYDMPVIQEQISNFEPNPNPHHHLHPNPYGNGFESQPNPVLNSTQTHHLQNAHHSERTNIERTNIDTDWIYNTTKYLTFSGGGTKGYSYLGCILMLDEYFRRHGKNLYNVLKGTSGTSVGAMYALLITLGVRGNKLINEVLTTDISHVITNVSIDNLMDMYGLNSCLGFKRQVFDILEKYIGKGDITFQELYRVTKKHYVCCVTNVTIGRAEYHSYLTTPHYKVFESVSASMSIPLIFAPTIINGHYYVDGGITDNSPFCVFPPDEVFVFYLQSNFPEMTSLQNYALRVAILGLRTIDQVRLKLLPPEYQKRRMVMGINDISSIDFHVTINDKKTMVLRGAECTEKFLNPDLIVLGYVRILTKLLFFNVMSANISTSQHQNQSI